MTLWHISHSSQSGVICKLAESTLCLIIQLINEDAKQVWTPYWPPPSASHWPPTRLCAADHHPLGLAIQPAFHPPHHLLIQPVHQQLVYGDLMGGSVKGFNEVLSPHLSGRSLHHISLSSWWSMTSPFCIWVRPGAICSSTQDSWHFLLNCLFVGMVFLWVWRRWPLNINQFSWALLPSRALSHRTLPSRSTKRPKLLSWSPRLWSCFCPAHSVRFRSWTPSHSHCSQWFLRSSHPPASPSWLVSVRSSRAPLLVVFSVTWSRKLPSMYFRNLLLVCLCPAVLSLQQIPRWPKFPWGPQPVDVRLLLPVCRGLSHLFFPAGWPIADTYYIVTFACLHFNPHP